MNFYVHFIYFSYFRPDKIRLIYPSHIILIDQIGNIGLAHMAGESMIKKHVSDVTHMSMDKSWGSDSEDDEDFVDNGESDDSDIEEVAPRVIDRRTFLEVGEDSKKWIPRRVKGAPLYIPPIVTGQNNVSDDSSLLIEEISLIEMLFTNQFEQIESLKNAKRVMNPTDYLKTSDLSYMNLKERLSMGSKSSKKSSSDTTTESFTSTESSQSSYRLRSNPVKTEEILRDVSLDCIKDRLDDAAFMINSYVAHTRKYEESETYKEDHTALCIGSDHVSRLLQQLKGLTKLNKPCHSETHKAMFDLYCRVSGNSYGRFSEVMMMPGKNCMRIKARLISL
jgi:hypothetical protein